MQIKYHFFFIWLDKLHNLYQKCRISIILVNQNDTYSAFLQPTCFKNIFPKLGGS
jgi:hypothetical protein